MRNNLFELTTASRLLLKLIAPILLCGVANAQESVVLTNGTRLTGRLGTVVCESQKVVFDLNGLGTATVRWDAIESMPGSLLDPNRALPAALTNDARTLVVPVNSSGESASANGLLNSQSVLSALATLCNPQKPLVELNRTTTTATEKQSAGTQSATAKGNGSFWVGKFESSSALTIGTQTQETLSGRVVLAYNRNPSANSWTKRTITQFDVEAAYGNAAKKNSPRIMTNQLSYGSFLQGFMKGQTTLYPFATFYHNFSQGMKLEQSYGFGVKYSFRSVDPTDAETVGQQIRRNFVFAGDIRAIHENFGNLQSIFSSPAVGISLDDSFHLGPITKMKLIVQTHVEIIPAFRSAKALQMRATSAFIVPLTKRLNVNFQFNDFYVRNPPPDHRQNYSKTQVSFGYLLGRIPK
jgi:hypothetical protein